MVFRWLMPRLPSVLALDLLAGVTNIRQKIRRPSTALTHDGLCHLGIRHKALIFLYP